MHRILPKVRNIHQTHYHLLFLLPIFDFSRRLLISFLTIFSYIFTNYQLYREGVEAELRTLTASDDEKRRMQDILRLLHQQQIEDLDGGSGGSEDEEQEEEISDDDEEELVPGFSLHRALLFAQGDLTLDDLTPEELAAFQKEVLRTPIAGGGGEGALEVQPWQPWWTTQAAAELQLSASGTKCIEEIVENTQVEHTLLTAQEQILIPSPPAAPLPPLSSLTSKPPSPALPLHLLDLLYSYCIVLRLFNGQYSTDVLDAATTVLSASSVLGDVHSPPSSTDVPSSVLLNSIVHVCSTEAGRSQVPRSFAIGILSDVAMVLQLGRSVVVTALTDLSRIVDAGLEEARTCITNFKSSSTDEGDSGETKTNKEELQQEYKKMITQLKLAQRKLLFFISWANEAADTITPALAMATGMVYEQQRATAVAQNEQNEPTIITKTQGTKNDIL